MKNISIPIILSAVILGSNANSQTLQQVTDNGNGTSTMMVHSNSQGLRFLQNNISTTTFNALHIGQYGGSTQFIRFVPYSTGTATWDWDHDFYYDFSNTIWGVDGDFKVDGKIGIGISNPNAKLDIDGQLRLSYDASTGLGGSINIDNPNGETPAISMDQGAQRWWQYVDSDDTYKIGRGSNYNSNIPTITLKSDKVGIGVTNPSKRLDIQLSNETDFLRIRRSSSTGRSQLVLADENGAENWRIGMTGSASTGFSFWDGSNNVLHLEKGGNAIFDPSGSVGIGTTTMGSHKLAVEGSIGAREIKVEASGWSDFVFENDYKLRTLEEVAEHIRENGHLPEIPSEAEVTENGINLGAMNAKLLQKIEELTLYMIDMNRRVNELETENQELKEKVNHLETK